MRTDSERGFFLKPARQALPMAKGGETEPARLGQFVAVDRRRCWSRQRRSHQHTHRKSLAQDHSHSIYKPPVHAVVRRAFCLVGFLIPNNAMWG
jgi:hypothetical protein